MNWQKKLYKKRGMRFLKALTVSVLSQIDLPGFIRLPEEQFSETPRMKEF